MPTTTTHPPKTLAQSSQGEGPSYALQLSGVESRTGEKNNKVEIGSQPVMIGSGPRCTLRLDVPGTKPVHCVVSLGEEGPVVRRWAAGTLLNGETFTEALLAEGDCLSIGTVDVEILRLDEADQPLAQESSYRESVSFDESEDFDPAVPQHLLAPWTADKSKEEVAENAKRMNTEAKEAPEQTTDPVEESACESLSEIEGWIGGESEWTVAEEATEESSEEEACEEVASEEDSFEENLAETNHDELPAELWAIEQAPVDELFRAAQDESEKSSAPLLSEEVSVWVTDNVSKESLLSSEAELEESDPFAASVVDAKIDEPAASEVVETQVETDHIATIALLRNRLSVRANRLRSVIAALRRERVEREEQETVVVETVALVERLQADLANVEQQASDDAASLADLQKELSAANELIETLEASLHDAIESTSGVAYEEPQEPTVETLVEVEVNEPVVEEEQSLWPDALGEGSQEVASLEETAISSEEPSETESEAAAPKPENSNSGEVVEPAVVAEDLWGIEQLTSEAPAEETVANEEPSVETVEEPSEEASIETPAEEPTKELTGSLDEVLLPGETAEELPVEPEAVSAPEEDSPVSEAIDDGNSVLASLMTRPLHETEEQADAPAEAESFIDRYAHMLPEDEAEESPVDSVEPALSENNNSAPALSDALGNEEGEESLDEYMKKMMDRIRGDEAPAVVAPKASQSEKVEATPAAASVAEEAVTPEPKQTPIQNLDELKRNPTRALGADLGELRQLANQSARRAIDVSETNDKKEHAAMRLTIAGIGATCGLLACLTSPSLVDWQFYAGLVGAVGGGYLGLRTIKVIQHAAALKANAVNEVNGTGI